MDYEKNLNYRLGKDGKFVLHNYNHLKPFSNFLPGVAGLYGVPLWAFYVNRGQGIASFGTRNKDNAILEFFPANKAYQMTPTVGFRTFIKHRVADVAKAPTLFYEPFSVGCSDAGAQNQVMEISSHELALSDHDEVTKLQTQVVYRTVPGEPIAALMRELILTNQSKKTMEIELLDGLPSVNPYGMNEYFVKSMSRTIEAWMLTENMDKKAPFFRLRVDATDRPEVEVIHEGNFYFSLLESKNQPGELLEPVVDPAKIFGSRYDFGMPQAFYQNLSRDILSGQVTENKTPCAFSYLSARIQPGDSIKLRSYFGQAQDREKLNQFVTRAKKAGFGDEKKLRNETLIQGIKDTIFGVTSQELYDLYGGQTYLDNILRGGMPICIQPESKTGNSPCLVNYVYSRKHGDLERDYNRFLVEPAYFAQGDGNYRDVNQNRRNDVWFEPRVGDTNVKTFFNLLQLDGYNPLVVKGDEYHFRKSGRSVKAVAGIVGAEHAAVVLDFLKKPFRLGALCHFFEDKGILPPSQFFQAVTTLAPFLEREEKADHGEGFWVDHWMYNLDLLESYLAIYPEKSQDLFLSRKDYKFFESDHTVQPRQDKYCVHRPGQIRQFKSVIKDKKQVGWVRVRQGKGEVYRTTLWVKLLCLFANKISSLDPFGAGLEMEADKPSWYDALNGLPGLLGSSLGETFELKRLALFLIQTLDGFELSPKTRVLFPEEIHHFITDLDRLLKKNLGKKGSGRPQDFWNDATSLRESYRAKTRLGLKGKELRMSLGQIRLFLERGREKVQQGIERSYDPKSGLYPTYFENEVTRFKMVHKKGKTSVVPQSFNQKPLPFFLEGPVHALKVEKDLQKRRALLKAVRESGLYDKKLGMYRVNTDLASASLEVGRARVFKPGWLENESIWLHMEYKWLLEMLKGGLTEEFFYDFKKALVPFQPAQRYGRSLLENSSFIVSSAFSDASLHGTGFVARLSGSTAEFLNLWLLMNIGKQPFSLGSNKKLQLRFEPTLPAYLFLSQECVRTRHKLDGSQEPVRVPKNSLAFLFLGKTMVVYHNPKRIDTFGKSHVWPKKITLSDKKGKLAEFEGDTIPDPWAKRVRDEHIARIDIELG